MVSVAVAAPASASPFDPSKGYTRVPNKLLRHPAHPLKNGPFRVYSYLLSYCYGHKTTCDPSQETISQDTGASLRSVRTWLRQLESLGYIRIRRRGLTLSNEYELLVTADADRQEPHPPAPPDRQNTAPKENVPSKKTKIQEDQDLRSSKPTLQQPEADVFDQNPDTLDQTARTLSAELGDLPHEKANVTRLTKLHQWSELPLDRFLAQVAQAKTITLSRTNLRQSGKQMAYFFKVLCNLLGVVEEKSYYSLPTPIGTPTTMPSHAAQDSQEGPVGVQDDQHPSAEETAWQTVLQALRERVSASTFETWFADTRLLSLAPGAATIGTETVNQAQWLRSKYTALIEETISQQLGMPTRCRFELAPKPLP